MWYPLRTVQGRERILSPRTAQKWDTGWVPGQCSLGPDQSSNPSSAASWPCDVGRAAMTVWASDSSSVR